MINLRRHACSQEGQIELTDDIVFELKKVFLHSSNHDDILLSNSSKIFKLLSPMEPDLVSVRHLLYVLTNIYEFFLDTVEEARGLRVLSEMDVSINGSMTLSRFVSFLRLVDLDRKKQEEAERLHAAWNNLFGIVLVGSVFGLVAVCAVYFSSASPSLSIIYIMVVLGVLIVIGSLFLLVVPTIRLLVIHYCDRQRRNKLKMELTTIPNVAVNVSTQRIICHIEKPVKHNVLALPSTGNFNPIERLI